MTPLFHSGPHLGRGGNSPSQTQPRSSIPYVQGITIPYVQGTTISTIPTVATIPYVQGTDAASTHTVIDRKLAIGDTFQWHTLERGEGNSPFK